MYLLYPLFRYEDIEPSNPIGINATKVGDAPINVHLIRLPFIFEDDVHKTKTMLTNVINSIFING